MQMMLDIGNLPMKFMNFNIVLFQELNGNQKQLVGQIWLE